MKVLSALISGMCRSLKSWKGILVIWFFTLLLVTLIASPLKSVVQKGIGKSMATELLADGIDIDVLSDLGEAMGGLGTYLATGLLLILFTGFLMNIFFSGGLFNSLRKSENRVSAGEFFRSSGKYFWSFLVISLITDMMILFLLFMVVIIPVTTMTVSSNESESAIYSASVITGSIFLLLVMILLLVADYARAWQVNNDKIACFRALRFGFSRTFKRFWSSFPMMIVIIAVQVLFGWVVLKLIPGWRPGTAQGVMLLFLTSQLLFFFKILLKAWRYGSVTALMEKNDSASHTEKQTNSDN